jgi:plastocyanin
MGAWAIRLAAAAMLASGAAVAGENHVVRIVTDYETLHFRFEPKVLDIEPGDTVTWVNAEAEDHNVVAYPGGFPQGAQGFASPMLSRAGETWSWTFERVGTYQYHCMPHLMMGMTGEIVVGRRSAPGEFHQPSRAELVEYRDRLLSWFDEDDNLFRVRLSDGHSPDGGH